MSRNKATTVSVFFVAPCENNHIAADLTSISSHSYDCVGLADNSYLISSGCQYSGELRPCFSCFRTV